MYIYIPRNKKLYFSHNIHAGIFEARDVKNRAIHSVKIKVYTLSHVLYISRKLSNYNYNFWVGIN